MNTNQLQLIQQEHLDYKGNEIVGAVSGKDYTLVLTDSSAYVIQYVGPSNPQLVPTCLILNVNGGPTY